jgi:hypothetical protein
VNEHDTWLAFQAVAITTQPVPAYGGFQAHVDLLHRLAQQYRSESVPMHANHDMLNGLRTRKVEANVRERADGYHELVLNGEVHEDDWARAKHLPGISVTLMVPIGESEPRADIALSADAAWFSSTDIAEAGKIVSGVLPTQSAEAYQFGLIPDPQIFIELTLATLQTLGPNLGASALWDGLKLLLLRRRVPEGADPDQATTINFSVTDRGGWTAVVKTNDRNVALKALETLGDVAEKTVGNLADSYNAVPARWDQPRGEWRAANEADDSGEPTPQLPAQ